MGASLGYEGKAAFGFDDITIGWQGAGGPTLKNQTLGGIATKDTYLGLFGLTPRSSNFTTFNSPIPGYIQNLFNQSLIPSTSWGYTAGNQYRLNRVLGSLTLGGYDRSKFVANDVSFSFGQEDVRDLTVQINSITSGDTKLLPTSIPAFLDSSLPYIWLPIEACTLFEKAFNLTWDSTTKLYPISDSQHTTLLAQSPNITFTLGNLTDGVSVDITLPYSAFDLSIQPPLVTNTTRYFPLKRAVNYTQYVLGRTFFQEAYVFADYDRLKFSVSQCKWVANSQQDIVSVLAPSLSGTSSGNGTSAGSGSSDSSKSTTPIGAIVGGIVGGLAVIAAIAAFFFIRRKRRRAAEAEAAKTAVPATTEEAPPPAPNRPELEPHESFTLFKPELDSSPTAARLELEGHKQQWNYEADGNPVEIYEMPAGDVAVEMRGEGQMSELRGDGGVSEMVGSGGEHEMQGSDPQSKRFSWMQTPIEMSKGPKRNWSWASTHGVRSPGGASDAGTLVNSPQSAVATVSPQSAVNHSPGAYRDGVVSPTSATPLMGRGREL